MIVQNVNDPTESYDLNLDEGAVATYNLCLRKNGCYSVEVGSGEWREEVSWAIVLPPSVPWLPSTVVLEGAAPDLCGFGASNDPDYYTEGWTGGGWWGDDNGDWGFYNYGDDGYGTDPYAPPGSGNEDWPICTVTSCDRGTDDEWNANIDDDYWDDDNLDDTDDVWGDYYGDGNSAASRCKEARSCKMPELEQGWQAVSDMSSCLEHSDMSTYATNDLDPYDPSLWYNRPELCTGDFDWQELDDFELCAQEYQKLQHNEERPLSEAALSKAAECMVKFAKAVPDPSDELESSDELVERLGIMVYYFGSSGFCDCAVGYQSVPKCGDFSDFQSVVEESWEACDALDQIDCPYLAYYVNACIDTLERQFGLIDLSDPDQCMIIDTYGCKRNPIPTVRKWDCLGPNEGSLTKAQRDFMFNVSAFCEKPQIEDDTSQPVGPNPFADDDYAIFDDLDDNTNSHEAGIDNELRHHHTNSDTTQPSGGIIALIVILSLIAGIGLGGLAVVAYKRNGGFLGSRYTSPSDPSGTDGNELTFAFAPLSSGSDLRPDQNSGAV